MVLQPSAKPCCTTMQLTRKDNVEITSSLLEIRRPTIQNIEETVTAAKDDNVHVIRATDILRRDGKIIGYLSIANIPSVHMWFHSKRATPRDYLTAMAHIDGVLSKQGIEDYWLPVESTSKLLPFVERLGYVKSNFDNVFIKTLK